MKKFMAFFIGILAIGVFAFDNDAFAAENTEGSSEALVDEKDGVNDPSTVNFKIRKISDEPFPEPLYDYPISLMGAGEWDLLGDQYVDYASDIYYSGGGNFKVVINQPIDGGLWPVNYKYKLVENDDFVDDTIGNFEFPGKGIFEMEFYVGSFVDGDNNKAEIKLLKLNMTSTDVYAYFWD